MDVYAIIEIIRKEYNGAWWALFHTAGKNVKFLPTGSLLTPPQYDLVKKAFTAAPKDTPKPVPAEEPKATTRPLSAEEIKKNKVRGDADAAARRAGGE